MSFKRPFTSAEEVHRQVLAVAVENTVQVARYRTPWHLEILFLGLAVYWIQGNENIDEAQVISKRREERSSKVDT